MAKLDFANRKKRVLEITLPDGSEDVLVIKPRPLDELDDHQTMINELLEESKAGKIGSKEYFFKVLESKFENFDRTKYGALELDDVLEILKAVNSSPEKKSE